RPGVMAALGVDYESLQAIHPRLIYCSISGYGQNGPYRSRAGHDLNYVGLVGLLPGISADNGGREAPTLLPRGQVADIGGSYAAAFSIVSALYGCQQTGRGAFLDIALT